MMLAFGADKVVLGEFDRCLLVAFFESSRMLYNYLVELLCVGIMLSSRALG